jgi:diketogulonate reductase-like aldo/keto reductase
MLRSTAAFALVANAAAFVPTITIGKDAIGNDVNLPLVGAGTWQYNNSVAYDSLCKSFEAGYNFVDTSDNYGNEVGVGEAIRDCWLAKGKNREDLFVMTKINGGLSRDQVLAAHKSNLDQLQLTYVDHLMTHFPGDWNEKPATSNPAARQEEWLALEEIYYSVEARSIGVSHYCSNHLDDVMQVATVVPSVNQVEYHVGSGDIDDVISKCAEIGTFFMSYSPLCGPCHYLPKDSLIDGDLVTEIASHYPGVSGAQVSLKFIVQQATAGAYGYRPFFAGVIPKADDAAYIAENINLFGFDLTPADMDTLLAAETPKATAGDCSCP